MDVSANAAQELQLIRDGLSVIRPRGSIVLVAIDPARQRGIEARTFVMPDDMETAVEWASERNIGQKLNVYFTVNITVETNRKPAKIDMMQAVGFWADCDPDVFRFGGYDNARAHLINVELPRMQKHATFVIDSGNGLSPFFMLAEPERIDGDYTDYEAINDRVGNAFGGGGTFNCDRVMRLPGTWNYPNDAKIRKGYPQVPHLASVIHQGGPVYTMDSAAAMARWVDLSRRFDDHLARHPKVAARYAGDASDLADKTGSAMDFSMVSMLKLGGFRLPEIRTLLANWTHGSASADRDKDRYWQRCWDRSAQSPTVVDLSELIKSGTIEPAAPAPKQMATFDRPIPVPVLEASADWMSGLSESPTPEISRVGTLAMASVASGRLYRSENSNWTSLMFVLSGPSGVGKNYVKIGVERALIASGLGHMIAGDFYTSQAALYSQLVTAPCHICVSDEFGENFLEARKSQSPHKLTVFKGLKKVYSDADHIFKPDSYSNVRLSPQQRKDAEQYPIANPALTLLGITTPLQFFGEIKSAHIESGLMNRLIVISIPDVERAQVARISDAVPDWMIEYIRRVRRADDALRHTAHNLAPVPVDVAISPEAWEQFNEFRKTQDAECKALESVCLDPLPKRWRENAMRLATCLAAWKCPESPAIDAEIAGYSIAYVYFYGRQTIDIIRSQTSDNDYHLRMNAVVEYVRSQPEGVSGTDISRKFRSIKKREMDEIKSHLIDAELIAETARTTSGRPVNIYVATR